MRPVRATGGEERFLVEAEAVFCGSDISVVVCGGTGHHIGAVSLAVYEPERDSATVSTMTVHTHRDDKVSAHFAKNISREMMCTVSASAGLHLDNASEQDIAQLWNSAQECCERLAALLRTGEGQ